MTQRNPEDPEPPWGARCAWPRSEPRIDTADAKRDRNDPILNEFAAHDAQRARMRLIENRRASSYNGRRL